jgi:hypothetical protein
MSEEEPGKILHEVRLDVSSGLALGGKSAYYGSVDATPLFVALFGEVSRWGFAAETISELLPHVDRALDWIRDYGDKDGDGFVEYERLNDTGLINQGWKDSWDGINFADGTLAEPPIALCEVQAYVYSAYMARSWIAYDAGDMALAAEYRSLGAQLKRQFNEQFWLPDRGYYAVALDGHKRPVDACTSNMGNACCLASSIRTRPRWWRNGSCPPRCSAAGACEPWPATWAPTTPPATTTDRSGPTTMRSSRPGSCATASSSRPSGSPQPCLKAAEYSEGRLPELFCGFSREHFDEPVPYPTACSPQAWAATTPIQLVKSLMGYYADVARGGLWMDPVLPESYGDLHITNAPMADSRITIDISGSVANVQGLPEGMLFHHGVRPWASDLAEKANHASDQHRPVPPPHDEAVPGKRP